MVDQPEILTVEDVSYFLRVPVSSVYKLAQQGKIPGKKVGKHWRFYRQTIVDWINTESSIITSNQSQFSVHSDT